MSAIAESDVLSPETHARDVGRTEALVRRGLMPSLVEDLARRGDDPHGVDAGEGPTARKLQKDPEAGGSDVGVINCGMDQSGSDLRLEPERFVSCCTDAPW